MSGDVTAGRLEKQKGGKKKMRQFDRDSIAQAPPSIDALNGDG